MKRAMRRATCYMGIVAKEKEGKTRLKPQKNVSQTPDAPRHQARER